VCCEYEMGWNEESYPPVKGAGEDEEVVGADLV